MEESNTKPSPQYTAFLGFHGFNNSTAIILLSQKLLIQPGLQNTRKKYYNY